MKLGMWTPFISRSVWGCAESTNYVTCPVVTAPKILQLHPIQKGMTSPKKLYSGHDTKMHMVVRLQFQSFGKCGVTPSLPLLSVPVVGVVRVSFMGQIDLCSWLKLGIIIIKACKLLVLGSIIKNQVCACVCMQTIKYYYYYIKKKHWVYVQTIEYYYWFIGIVTWSHINY